MKPSPEARGIWRFAADLPVTDPDHRVTLGEGDTPLVSLDALVDRPSGLRLWAKDESLNPTLSHKDRFMALAMTRARQAGVAVVAAASTGNGGISAAAYAARAGLRCVVLTTPDIPAPPRRYILSLGAALVPVADAATRWSLIKAAARQWGWFPLTNVDVPPSGSNPAGMPAYKTIAHEIAEQTGVPDLVAAPLALGDLLAGLHQGFAELMASGRSQKTPRLIAIAPEAAPSVAYNVGSRWLTEQARSAIEATDGRFLEMPEADIAPLQDRLARSCGVFAEASSVLAVWGACHATESTASAVAVVTSSGLKDPLPGDEELPPLHPIENSLDALKAALPEGFVV